MTVYCYNCGEPVHYKLTTPFRRLSCDHCHRLVFREVRFWGSIWIVFAAVIAILVGIRMFHFADTIKAAWSIYLVYIVPGLTLALLSPLGNLVILLAYKLKYPQSRL